MPDMIAYKVTDTESISFIALPKLIRYKTYDLTLLPQPVEIHYISNYENFRIYFILLWKDHPFRAITVT